LTVAGAVAVGGLTACGNRLQAGQTQGQAIQGALVDLIDLRVEAERLADGHAKLPDIRGAPPLCCVTGQGIAILSQLSVLSGQIVSFFDEQRSIISTWC
jgi:hypothetical protein